MTRSIEQLTAEKIDFDYEEEILQTVQELTDEVAALARDLERDDHGWEHTEGEKEPLWEAIVYHNKHIQMILDELFFKRAPYVEDFLADWESSGLIQEEDGISS